MTIKAVFFDFGGVFTTSPFLKFHNYEVENGLPEGFLRLVNSTNHEDNAWAQFEVGKIDEQTFNIRFEQASAALGHKVSGSDVIAMIYGDLIPEMITALGHLKQRYFVGCLTNNLRPLDFDHPQSQAEAQMFEVFKRFDYVLQSAECGLRKPDTRFYEKALKDTGYIAHEVVFLDDLGINLKAAKSLGMTTIKVLKQVDAIKSLESVLALPPGSLSE